MKSNKNQIIKRIVGFSTAPIIVTPSLITSETLDLNKSLQNNNENVIISLSDVILPEYANIGVFASIPTANTIIYTLNSQSTTWTTKDNWYSNQVVVSNLTSTSATIIPINGSQIYSGSATLNYTIDPNKDKLDLDQVIAIKDLYVEENTVWRSEPTKNEVLRRFWEVNNQISKNDNNNLYIDQITQVSGENYQATIAAKPESYRYKGQSTLNFVVSTNANTGMDVYPDTGYIANNDEGTLEFVESGEYTINANDQTNTNRSITIDADAEVTLNIEGSMQIEPESGSSGINVKPGGDLTITLKDGATIKIVAHDAPAIATPEGASLYLRGNGNIVASSDGYGCAVIGSAPDINSGDINILDGINVSATLLQSPSGANPGVAIGAGVASSCNHVYINTTGTVIADNQSTSSDMFFFGAAIGGGGSWGESKPAGTVKEITIDNGNVYAYGATVTTTNGATGATIGSGAIRNSTGTTLEPFGVITINGGFVFAEERGIGNGNHRDGVAIGAGGAMRIGGTWQGTDCNGTFILNGGTIITKQNDNGYSAGSIGYPDVANWSNTSLIVNGGNVIRTSGIVFSKQPNQDDTSVVYPVYAKLDQTGSSGNFSIASKTFGLTDKLNQYLNNCSAAFYLPVGSYTTTINSVTYSVQVTANNYSFADAQTNQKNILIPQ